MRKAIKPGVDWQAVKLVIFDCDGVLSDGKIIYGLQNGMEKIELKNFNAHDGMGLTLLHLADMIPAVITGRSSAALSQRCRDLRIKFVFQKVQNKLAKAEQLIEKLGLQWSQTVYMGDDWNDIPCMQKAALSACPADAPEEIRKLADLIVQHRGGEGAARDLIEHILNKKGIYNQVVEAYLQDISD